MLVRPCLLVIDSEHPNSISSRKLVLETAKYNVITAYNCAEATATLERFPTVHALVFNHLLSLQSGYGELAEAIRQNPDVKVVMVGDGPYASVQHRIDAEVESFAPTRLLSTIQQLFPVAAQQMSDHEGTFEDRDQ